jgi:hypothetical protein
MFYEWEEPMPKEPKGVVVHKDHVLFGRKRQIMSKPFKDVINLDVRDSTRPTGRRTSSRRRPRVRRTCCPSPGTTPASARSNRSAGRDPDDAEAGRRRADLQKVPHDGALLADACVVADRPQPHDGRHGLRRRGDDGLPGSNGHIPFETATIAEVLSEWGLQHLHARQVALLSVDETNMASGRAASLPW